MTISIKDRKLLWGRSGSRCAICGEPVIVEKTDDDPESIVGDECHIVAQSPGGPRGGETLEVEVDSYANLIILCRTHHKEIDDQPNTYSSEKLRQIKAAHENRVTLQRVSESLDVRTARPSLNIGGFENAAFLPADFTSDVIFSMRISDAFPGSTGLTVIESEVEAVQRLEVLLRDPLAQLHRAGHPNSFTNYPLWWFRGSRNMYVNRFEKLSPTACLIDFDELLIKRVASFRAYTSPSLRDFVYVEVRGQPPIGVYEHDPNEIAEALQRKKRPFLDEEYAIWRDKPITRMEYDDGSVIVNGKPTRVENAQLRVRYLTPYNFLICGNRHVINESRFDADLERHMDRLLRNESTLSELVAFVRTLPIPSRYGVTS